MDAKHISPTEAGSTHLLERMLFLSDGVFAIVMTLLVLDLRIPEGIADADFISAFIGITPKLIAFTMSFALVSVFWAGHVSITRELQKFDWAVAWANLGFLFFLAWAPFAATLLGQFGAAGDAWRFYCLVLIAMGTAQAVLLLVITRENGRLIGGLERRQFWYRLIRALSPGTGFMVALAFSLAGMRLLSNYSWILIPMMMFAARLVLKEPKAKSAPAAATATVATTPETDQKPSPTRRVRSKPAV